VSTRQPTGPRPVGVHFDGDLRRALLDAAAQAVAVEGPEHLSLREVARRLGVSHAAPAHHFGDKAGLLTALATEGFDRFVVDLAAAAPASSASPAGARRRSLVEATPVARLAGLGRAYAAFADRHPGHFAVMFRPALIRVDDAEFVRASDAAFDALRVHVAACQAAGWHAGADPEALTVGAWALAHGVSVLRSQGALIPHFRDHSLDGVVAIAEAMLADS
jgi:AcrR family transcriptional regulator